MVTGSVQLGAEIFGFADAFRPMPVASPIGRSPAKPNEATRDGDPSGPPSSVRGLMPALFFGGLDVGARSSRTASC